MNIYITPSVATALATSGPGNAAATVVSLTLNSVSYSCPLRVSAETTLAKSGVRRVLLKSVITVPTDLALNGQSTEDVTLHTVLTLGPQVVAGMNANIAYADALAKLVGVQVAMLTVGRSNTATTLAPTTPLRLGAQGIYPLDTVSGVYGQVTA